LTISAVAETIVLKGAIRVLDVDFGSPPEHPVADARVRLPATGNSNDGSTNANQVVLIVGLAVSALLAVGLAIRSRDAARR
jgi:hypothetical protein